MRSVTRTLISSHLISSDLILTSLLRPQEGAKYCDEYRNMFVCLSVCPLLYMYLANYTDELHQIFCACRLWSWVIGLSYVGFAIRYVLPVLWMTPCFSQWALWRTVRINKRREINSRNYCIGSYHILLQDKDLQVHIVGVHRGRSLLSTVALFHLK